MQTLFASSSAHHHAKRVLSTKKSAALVFSLFALPFLASPADAQVAVSPATAALTPGQQITLKAIGAADPASCSWVSSNPSALLARGNGSFLAEKSGAVMVTATCAGIVATANLVVVSSQQTSGPLVITQGGTYSGTYISTNPKIPAVKIVTDQPVTLTNSFLSSKGNLINIQGSAGANVTIQNVTGVALDPGSRGKLRGEFVSASTINSLTVQNCSMYGVSYGVELYGGAVSSVRIVNNLAGNLDDRSSDGNGGFLATRKTLGHFVIFEQVVAAKGAEIGWNQVVNTIGSTSNEDVINIYKSQGSAGYPINVHDNYAEGYSSPPSDLYTGTGVIADGDGLNPQTAYLNINANEFVHNSGTGVAIASGHDVHATNNRVVSCGVDSLGNWYSAPFAQAVYLWNYNGTPGFYNNTITGTYGGLIRQDPNGDAMIADSWASPTDLVNVSNSIAATPFADPCMVNGSINFGAEDTERKFWAAKKLAAHQLIGDQHTL